MLSNCALLLAYVYGEPGGWYAICRSHIDGFPCDYALIHSNPGDLEIHAVRAFYLDGTEVGTDELDAIRKAVSTYNRSDEPPVTTLTEEEIDAAAAAVRAAREEEEPEDPADWLQELCRGGSDLAFCNWEAVVEAVK
jgi:hypothetical protein